MSTSDLRKNFRLTAILSGIVLLTACGGGGGDTIETEPALTEVTSPSDPGTAPVQDPDPVEAPTGPTEPEDPAPAPAPTEPAPTEPAPTEPPPPSTAEPIPTTPDAFVALNCPTCQTNLKDVVVDAAGNATVAWAENDNGVSSIKAARYDAAAGTWTRQTLASGTPATLQLGVDQLGNVKAAWLIGGAFSMAQFDAATGTWGAPRQFFRANVVPAGPEAFAVDPQGNAFFAYLWQPGTLTAEGFPVESAGAFIYTAADDTWKRGRVDGATEQALGASIDVDDAGNAILTWGTRMTGEPGSYRGKVYASRYRPENGYWGTVREYAASGAFDPQVELRPNGRAALVYGVTANGTNDILLRQYDPAVSIWTAARSLGVQSTSPAVGLNVEVDRDGNAFVAWAEAERGQLVRRYNAATDSLAPIISYNDGAVLTAPDIAVDSASGNAVHTYADALQGTTNIVRYTRLSDIWSAPVALNNPGEGGSTAEVEMGPDSVAVATWTQASGETTATGPVQNLKARRVAP